MAFILVYNSAYSWSCELSVAPQTKNLAFLDSSWDRLCSHGLMHTMMGCIRLPSTSWYHFRGSAGMAHTL